MNNSRKQLIDDMLAEEVDLETAERLADETPEVCRRQLNYLDYQDDQDDRASTLVASIESDWPEPARSYWANIAKQYQDKPDPQQSASNETDFAHSANSTSTEETFVGEPEELIHIDAAQTDVAVAKLLEALESIATMQHAHRAASEETPCPVCVAWDALKSWSHRQAVGE
jgi:hypothetical protein